MITFKKPEGKHLNPLTIGDILTNTGSDIFVIENVLQREYVWDINNIETLWNDIKNCIENNIEHPEQDACGNRIYQTAYMHVGDLEYSQIDKCNESYKNDTFRGTYKSIVDGSQRCRTCLFMLLAILYEKALSENKEFIDTSPIKTRGGDYKLLEFGINKLDSFYEFITRTPVKKIKKDLKPLEKLFKPLSEINCERKYLQIFNVFVNFIEADILGVYNITDVLNIIMNNIIFEEKYIEPEYKFERFVDRNKKGTPMSDESMYPSYIINHFEDANEKQQVYDACQNFKNKAKKVEEEDKKFRKTKKGLTAVLFIMIQVLKEKLAIEISEDEAKKVFTTTFDLSNINYGIEKCFRNGLIFHDYRSAIDFFNTCSDIADFLTNKSFSQLGNLSDECYYLKDAGHYNMLWWYFIQPCYLATKYANRENFVFTKALFMRMYTFFSIFRASNTNTQCFMNFLEDMSYLIISKGKSEEYQTTAKEKARHYIKVTGKGYESLEIIYSLTIGNTRHKNAMRSIFGLLEYAFCEENNLPTDSLFKFYSANTKNMSGIDMDHWLPENIFKGEENKYEYQRIGNIVPIESPLNRSKQDNTGKNADIYPQSQFIVTKMMLDKQRSYYNNVTLNNMNRSSYKRYTEDELNHPTLAMINERTTLIQKKVISFIKDFIGE